MLLIRLYCIRYYSIDEKGKRHIKRRYPFHAIDAYVQQPFLPMGVEVSISILFRFLRSSTFFLFLFFFCFSFVFPFPFFFLKIPAMAGLLLIAILAAASRLL